MLRPLQPLTGRGELAILVMDLDRFKYVNDTLGHPAGDALLKMVAQRLRRCVRENDIIARLGGDEFTIVLPELRDTSPGNAVRFGGRCASCPGSWAIERLPIRSSPGRPSRH